MFYVNRDVLIPRQETEELVELILNELDSDRKKINIIVSNPPYVKESEKRILDSRVVEYEPSNAIFVSDDNYLIFYKAISDFALKNLSKRGKLYVEINEEHGDETVNLFKNKGFLNVILIKDINGKNRFISCNI